MKVPLLDLNIQHRKLKPRLCGAFARVVDHGKFILGPEVELLEKEVASLCAARHAVACASGSDALLLSLMAFGIGPGDEVITSPYSFFATASCIARVGARAVFADISLRCYNLDPHEARAKISRRTKAIIPVHLFGQATDMRPWLQLARERGIRIIEDAAQAIGAELDHRPVGAIGDVGCLSFFPTKNLGGLGDGGMLLTHDDKIAAKLRILRVHGAAPRYHHDLLGVNSRLDTLQAALLRVKLPHLAKWTEARRRNAGLYTRLMIESGLADSPSQSCTCAEDAKLEPLKKPLVLPVSCHSRHVYNQFVIRTRNVAARDPLREHLKSVGVSTEIYYPVPLHLQKCFSTWAYHAGDFPNSERASASTIALPIFPELTAKQLRYVVRALASFDWRPFNQ